MLSKKEYWRNPEKHRRKTREYALAHPDWKRDSDREWMRQKRARDDKFMERERIMARRRRAAMTDEQKAARRDALRAWHAQHPNYNRDYQRQTRGSDPARSLLNQARVRARKRGLPFSITRADIVVPERCPVLGIVLDPKATGTFNPASISLDRIIPELGYVPDNVCVISNRANILKRDATADELQAVADYVRVRGRRVRIVPVDDSHQFFERMKTEVVPPIGQSFLLFDDGRHTGTMDGVE